VVGNRLRTLAAVLASVRQSGLAYTYNLGIDYVIRTLFRKHLRPSIYEFYELNLRQRANEIITLLYGDTVPAFIEKEFAELAARLKTIYSSIKLKYPHEFKMEDETAFLLYSFVRLYKPDKIVETGVADGFSTFFLLNALNNNNKGKLYSIDINSDVGSLVLDELRERWQLIILSKPYGKNLEKSLIEIAPFDIFIHDSNHVYFWQSLEYKLAFKYIRRNGGYIMTDDADSSYAFLDFCRAHGLDPVFLFDSRKIFGIVKV
jgi:hypothetical protein